MRNAMTNGFLPYTPPEGGLVNMRITRMVPFGDDTGQSTPGAFGMNFGLGGPRGATASVSPAAAAQRTQAFAPIPTLADMPAMPSFSTMTPFQPYQSGAFGQQGGYQPMNYMARSAYAPPPAAPYSGGYGGGYGGSTYGNYGGFNPYSQMF